MLQLIEIYFLSFCQTFLGLPIFFVVVPILIGVAFLFLQFQRKTAGGFVPGILALCFFGVAYYFLFDNARAQEFIQMMMNQLQSPGPHTPEFPIILNLILDPLFALLVAPHETRYFHEEMLFVIGSVYIYFVGKTSWEAYKTTGQLVGDLSLAPFIGDTQARPDRSDANELGSGDLANAEQIASYTKKNVAEEGEDGYTILPVTDLSGSGGKIYFKTANLFIPREIRNRHMLTVAKTGSGKTSRLILPVLLSDIIDPDRSVIIIDSKPEMWENLANYSRKYAPHRKILRFSPLDIDKSLSWNFLSKIKDDSDCKLIANTIIMATDNPNSKGDSPFFKNNALSILNAVMVGLLNDENETLSMPRIHELVQSGMKPLCDWLEAHPESYRTSRTFVELARSGSQNADTIMSELGMRLSAWDLSAIRATTAMNELDVEDLVSKPTMFIVEFKESELEMLRPMANVIVVELLRFLTKRAESCPGHTLPRPVGFVIDEFASALGRLPDIHVKLNTLRSRNVSIVAAIQSINQVKANYGDDADSVLAGFSTRIMMPSLDVADAEWASKETGQMTIRFKTASSGSNKKLVEWFASKNISTQEQVQQRAVLTPDEIGRPSDNRATFFLPKIPPFQGHLVPYYKNTALIANFNECKKAPSFNIREQPIDYKDAPPPAPPPKEGQAGGGGGGNGLPPGISDTRGWDDQKINDTLNGVKKELDWENTTGSARKWWEAFESENQHRKALVLRLAEELKTRKATVTEFFLAYVYSNTDNIQANLHYLDYTRLKKEEERKKKEAQQQQGKQAAA